MDCGMSIVKFIVFTFNLLCALGGLALLVLGAFIQANIKFVIDVVNDYKFTAPAIVLIVVGSIIFIIAFLGCCGAAKESHCMLISYAVLLCCIFIVEVVIASLAFVYRKDAEDLILKSLDDMYTQYPNDPNIREIVDSMQTNMQCCGENGPLDWFGTLPKSCFPSDSLIPYTSGCRSKLVEFMNWSGNVLGGVALGIAAIEIVGIIFSCCLANTIKNEERRRKV